MLSVRALSARTVFPLNVFRLPDAQGQFPRYRIARFKFLSDVLQKIYGGIGPKQRNYLKRAVIAGLRVPNPPIRLR